MKKTLFFLILLISAFTFGQNTKSDSLVSLLKNENSVHDYEIYMELAELYKKKTDRTGIVYGTKALDIATALGNKSKQSMACSKIVNCFISTGNFDTAFYYCEKGLSFALEAKDTVSLAKLWLMKGAVFINIDDNTNAMHWFLKAKELYEQLADYENIAKCCNNIAIIYRKIENYPKSVEYYNKAISLYEKINNIKDIPGSLNNIAIVYKRIEKYDSAFYYYNKALEINIKQNDKHGISQVYHNMAYIFMVTTQYSKALELVQKSLDMKYELNNKKGIAASLILITEIYVKMSNVQMARKYLEKASIAVKAVNTAENRKSLFELSYMINKMNGNHKAAMEYLEKFKTLSDSIMHAENKAEIENMGHKIKMEKMQGTIDNLSKDNEYRKKQYMYTIIIALLIIASVVVILMLILKEYRLKKKSNRMLGEMNEELKVLNEEIMAQKDEIEAQRDEIFKKNKNLTDSIVYAKKIQKALLPPIDCLQNTFTGNFISFMPRNIVSGDFYWFTSVADSVKVMPENGNSTESNVLQFVAAADCTGHGVPGAFMSMLGVSMLNDIVIRRNFTEPAAILDEMRNQIKTLLRQTGERNDTKDGMDIALCAIDLQQMTMKFAGANNPLWMIKNDELKIENESKVFDNEIRENTIANCQLSIINSDRQPIGIYPREKQFTNHEVKLQKGDKFYIFSDGYESQFGGEKGDKLKLKRMQEIIVSVAHKPMDEQKQILEQKFDQWRGHYEQVDDVLVIGVEI